MLYNHFHIATATVKELTHQHLGMAIAAGAIGGLVREMWAGKLGVLERVCSGNVPYYGGDESWVIESDARALRIPWCRILPPFFQGGFLNSS